MQCNVDTGGCFSFAMAVQYDEGNEWLVLQMMKEMSGWLLQMMNIWVNRCIYLVRKACTGWVDTNRL